MPLDALLVPPLPPLEFVGILDAGLGVGTELVKVHEVGTEEVTETAELCLPLVLEAELERHARDLMVKL